MRTITAAFPIPTQAASSQAHSWIDALAAFGVPYLCYAGDGRRIHVSERARDLIDGSQGADGLAQQADRVVAEELRTPRWHPGLEQFPLVREVRTSSQRLLLCVHVARSAVAGVAVVVIMTEIVVGRELANRQS